MLPAPWSWGPHQLLRHCWRSEKAGWFRLGDPFPNWLPAPMTPVSGGSWQEAPQLPPQSPPAWAWGAHPAEAREEADEAAESLPSGTTGSCTGSGILGARLWGGGRVWSGAGRRGGVVRCGEEGAVGRGEERGQVRLVWVSAGEASPKSRRGGCGRRLDALSRQGPGPRQLRAQILRGTGLG